LVENLDRHREVTGWLILLVRRTRHLHDRVNLSPRGFRVDVGPAQVEECRLLGSDVGRYTGALAVALEIEKVQIDVA